MKRLILPLLLALVATNANAMSRARPQPASNPVVQLEGFDEDGNLTFRTTDRGGQTAASGGAVADTGATRVAEKLAEKVQGASTEWGYISLTRSAVDQPDSAVEAKLETNAKAAGQAYAQALQTGASGNVAGALADVAKSAMTQLGEYRRAKALAPKPDTSGISITAFLAGESANETLAVMGSTFGTTLAAKERAQATLNTGTVFNDTTNSNDWQGIAAIANLKAQLEIERLKAAIAHARRPLDEPTPKPDVDPAPVPDTDGMSPEARHKSLYPNVQLTGGNNGTAVNHSLWKPDADQGADGLVIVTQHNLPRISKLEIIKSGVVVKDMGIEDVVTAGNGYRLNWRIGGQYGGQYTVRVQTVDGTYSVAIPEGNKRHDNLQFKKDGGGLINDPQPGPTNAVIRAWSPSSITLSPAINARAVRVQVVHTRNGFHPAFPVSGVAGAGVENGFQWINLKWNASGTYTAEKPLAEYPTGKRGAPVWLVTSKPGMGGAPFYKDGNLVITAEGKYLAEGQKS